MSDLDIPIVKLTIDHMKTSILHALDPEILSRQLERSVNTALCKINFLAIVKETIESLIREVFSEGDLMQDIREVIYKTAKEAINKTLKVKEKKTSI